MLEPLVFSILISAIGNLLYGLAQWFGSAWYIVIARFVVGFGAGNAALSMAYVSRVTTAKNRTQYLASINGLNLLGIVMGPALNVVVKSIDWKPFGDRGPQLNEKTNPGYFMVIFLLIELSICLFVFQEPKSKNDDICCTEDSNVEGEEDNADEDSKGEDTNGSWYDRAVSDIRRMISRGAYVSYVVFEREAREFQSCLYFMLSRESQLYHCDF